MTPTYYYLHGLLYQAVALLVLAHPTLLVCLEHRVPPLSNFSRHSNKWSLLRADADTQGTAAERAERRVG